MAIDTGFATQTPYAVPGESIRFGNDIQERFVGPYERKLAREQDEQKFMANIFEQRRIQNAKDLKDQLDFNPEVLRTEYQPYITDLIQKDFLPKAQKAKLGAHLTTEQEEMDVVTSKGNILKKVNMINKLDQKVQGYYKFMNEENERQSKAGRAPEYDITYGLGKLNSLFKNDDGSVKDPEQIDFDQLDNFFADQRTGLIGARFENFFTDLDQMSVDMMEEVPAQGGNPAWKIMGFSWADVFEQENKGGLMVPRMVNGKPVPKATNELLYLIRTERPDLYAQAVEDANIEKIPLQSLVERAIGLHQGKLYKSEIKETRNITNPYAAQGIKRGEKQANVSDRVANIVGMVKSKDPTLLGIIKTTAKYQGEYPIIDAQYVAPMGPFLQGEQPGANAIEITYKVNDLGIPQLKKTVLSLDREEDISQLYPQINAYQNKIDEGTGKSVTWDEFIAEYRRQTGGQKKEEPITSPTKKKIPGL